MLNIRGFEQELALPANPPTRADKKWAKMTARANCEDVDAFLLEAIEAGNNWRVRHLLSLPRELGSNGFSKNKFMKGFGGMPALMRALDKAASCGNVGAAILLFDHAARHPNEMMMNAEQATVISAALLARSAEAGHGAAVRFFAQNARLSDSGSRNYVSGPVLSAILRTVKAAVFQNRPEFIDVLGANGADEMVLRRDIKFAQHEKARIGLIELREAEGWCPTKEGAVAFRNNARYDFNFESGKVKISVEVPIREFAGKQLTEEVREYLRARGKLTK